MGESLPHHHEDHIAGRGNNSLQHHIWFTSLFLCLKLWKFQQQKQQWTRKGKNWRKFRSGTWRKSEAKKRWSMKQGRRAQKFILHHWWTDVIWKNAELEAKHQKYKGRVVLRGWYCKKRFWVLRSIHWTRIYFSISNDSRQDHGYHLQIASLRWTSGRRSISLYPSENGRCSQIVKKNPKSECPDTWIRLRRHKWPKSWSSVEDPIVPLERNLYGHHVARQLWERQSEKDLLKIRLGEGFHLKMFIRTPSKRIILICVRGWHKIGWKETKHWSDVESTQQRSRFGRTNIFPWSMYTLGCTQRQCEISKDVVDNYRTMFESRISAGGAKEITILSKSSYFIMVWWHGWSCKEMCGTDIVRLANKPIQQLYKVSTPCIDDHHFKEEEMKSVGELSKKVCSQIVLKMLLRGTCWQTWYFMVSE